MIYSLIIPIIIGLCNLLFLYNRTHKPKRIFYQKIYKLILILNFLWFFIFFFSLIIFKIYIVVSGFDTGFLAVILYPVFIFMIYKGFEYFFLNILERKPNLLSKGSSGYKLKNGGSGWISDFIFTMSMLYIPPLLCLIIAFKIK